MKIEIDVTEEQIKEAFDRQVRVTMGQYFNSTEVKHIVNKTIKDRLNEMVTIATVSITQEEINSMYKDMLKSALEAKVKSLTAKL